MGAGQEVRDEVLFEGGVRMRIAKNENFVGSSGDFLYIDDDDMAHMEPVWMEEIRVILTGRAESCHRFWVRLTPSHASLLLNLFCLTVPLVSTSSSILSLHPHLSSTYEAEILTISSHNFFYFTSHFL